MLKEKKTITQKKAEIKEKNDHIRTNYFLLNHIMKTTMRTKTEFITDIMMTKIVAATENKKLKGRTHWELRNKEATLAKTLQGCEPQ